jgi:hypothetical protein
MIGRRFSSVDRDICACRPVVKFRPSTSTAPTPCRFKDENSSSQPLNVPSINPPTTPYRVAAPPVLAPRRNSQPPTPARPHRSVVAALTITATITLNATPAHHRVLRDDAPFSPGASPDLWPSTLSPRVAPIRLPSISLETLKGETRALYPSTLNGHPGDPHR